MSAKALHLNLLNPQELQPTSQVRLKVILPIAAGIISAIVLFFGIFFGIQLLIVNGQISGVRGDIARLARESAENQKLTAKYKDLHAESEQFEYYLNGRVERGELLKRLASAIPENITLTELSIPQQPAQELTPPPGSRLPPLQGPTQRMERVELHLTGLAVSEHDVFKMMNELKGNAFTGIVRIAEHPAKGERESPRVLAFRQETARPNGNGNAPATEHRHVFFDIVYDLKPREFVK